MFRIFFIVSLSLISITEALAQQGSYGFYVNKSLGYVTLRINPDSTFKEVVVYYDHVPLHCVGGVCDSIFPGTWQVMGDTLQLAYDPPYAFIKKRKFLICDWALKSCSEPVGALKFYKFRDYDAKGILTWKLEPRKLIAEYDGFAFGKNRARKQELSELLVTWLPRDQDFILWSPGFLSRSGSRNHQELQQIFFIRQFEYLLDNSGSYDQMAAYRLGVEAMITAYRSNRISRIPELEEMISWREKGKLDKWLQKNMQP